MGEVVRRFATSELSASGGEEHGNRPFGKAAKIQCEFMRHFTEAAFPRRGMAPLIHIWEPALAAARRGGSRGGEHVRMHGMVWDHWMVALENNGTNPLSSPGQGKFRASQIRNHVSRLSLRLLIISGEL